MTMKTLLPAERIEQRIYLIRGHKVMLDIDLARLYGVPTKSLSHRPGCPEGNDGADEV